MYEYLKHAHSDGLMHAEIFFDPQAHTDRGVPLEIVVQGLRHGIERGEKEWDVTADLIMCFLRHLPESSALKTFHSAKSLNYFTSSSSSSSSISPTDTFKKIVGVGLDSAELPFPPILFKSVFEAAGAAGLQRTAHAGEEGPAGYIQSALDDLQVTRIDHGIRLIDDPKVLDQIAYRGVLLTVCPLSNVRLRAVECIEQLPIRQFLERNVKFSINSDDPAYFGGYILDNYVAVQKAHGLSKTEWLRICENGIAGSWCCDERKQQMRKRLSRVDQEFDGL